MADRALAVPTMLVLNGMKFLAPDAPREVNPRTLVVMREGMSKEIDRLDCRYSRFSELTDFFDDTDNPTLEKFRKALGIFFCDRSQEQAETHFLFNYNTFLKEESDPWALRVDETLFVRIKAKSDQYADLAEEVGLLHTAATKELCMLMKLEELVRDQVTRREFFDEMLKFDFDLRAIIDE